MMRDIVHILNLKKGSNPVCLSHKRLKLQRRRRERKYE